MAEWLSDPKNQNSCPTCRSTISSRIPPRTGAGISGGLRRINPGNDDADNWEVENWTAVDMLESVDGLEARIREGISNSIKNGKDASGWKNDFAVVRL